MRNMLLSFKVEVFEIVKSGEKIYEHRRVFPDGPVKAYLYVSHPVKAVCGIMYLNNKVDIESWKEKYSYDKDTVRRIDAYLQNYKYAMEITVFFDTNEIKLETLRNEIRKFIVPQMYYFIDETELLSYLEEKLVLDGSVISYDFADVTCDMICKK